jgi:pyruvate dehydrogenase E1 component alpha subunit/2-oxoisovalerate dehydrogenase E1 component alpha subunit
MSDLTPERKINIYRLLRLNRLVEERLVHLYRQGKLVGGLYRSLGQEATSVGSALALESGDILGPLIRNLGSVLAMGVAPREIFTQYMARGNSPTGGKEGILHFGRPQEGLVSPTSMLGTLIPVMAGIALAGRMQGKKIVAMTFIGDGGTSTGPFHEGLNFAAVQRLPLVVVAENNGWAYSTPFRKQTAARSLADRGVAYGIPTETIDGNDVEAVYEASRRAVERAREGGGPTLLEAKTYRMKGHAEHDGQTYVPKEELDDWSRKDPIDRYALVLVKKGVATQEKLMEIDDRISAEIDRDVEHALASPPPPPENALKDVYAAGLPEFEPVIVRRRW